MSVLIQRPHQVPGLISLPRSSTPRRQQHHDKGSVSVQSTRRDQTPAVPPVLSPKVNRRQRGTPSPNATTPNPPTSSPANKRRSSPPAPQSPPTSASTPISIPTKSSSSGIESTVSASLSAAQSHLTISNNQSTIPILPTTPARNNNNAANKGHRSAPTTPNPPNALPVPANRRRARSPRPTARLPVPIADSPTSDDGATATPAKRGRRNNAPGSIPIPSEATANWQQAALLKKSSQGAGLHTTGSFFDAPSSAPVTPAKVPIAHSATPNTVPRPSHHARAPSVPAFPALDVLFSSAMTLPVTPPKVPGHTRGFSVSSSLPPSTSLHARMAKRERTPTGGSINKFAGASFQSAPDAMVLPKPGMFGSKGMFGSLASSSSDESSSSSEGEVVDDEDEVIFFA